MIITEISAQKRKGRYNLYVDGAFYSGVDAETIVKAGLKVGSEVDKKSLDELIMECEVRSAFDKLIGLISRQMYSKRDLEKKLLDKGYSHECIKKATEKAEEYGYINDELYAKLLVESKTLKSKREIKNSLFLNRNSQNHKYLKILRKTEITLNFDFTKVKLKIPPYKQHDEVINMARLYGVPVFTPKGINVVNPSTDGDDKK